MKNYFSGRRPSHYHMNSVVKAFIISESFFWSGYNFVYPLLSIFIVEKIVGGTIEIAAISVSVYMIARVIAELISGKLLEGKKDRTRLIISILGIFVISLSYMGFSFIQSTYMVYVLQAIFGFSLGIVSPAKYSMFSQHLNKNHASNEWSIYDAVTYIGMALSAAIGGFVAQKYGFEVVFQLAGLFIFLGIIPYVLILVTEKDK